MKYQKFIVRLLWVAAFFALSFFYIATLSIVEHKRGQLEDGINEALYMIQNVMGSEEMVYADGKKEHILIWHKDNRVSVGMTGLNRMPSIALVVFLGVSFLFVFFRGISKSMNKSLKFRLFDCMKFTKVIYLIMTCITGR